MDIPVILSTSFDSALASGIALSWHKFWQQLTSEQKKNIVAGDALERAISYDNAIAVEDLIEQMTSSSPLQSTLLDSAIIGRKFKVICLFCAWHFQPLVRTLWETASLQILSDPYLFSLKKNPMQESLPDPPNLLYLGCVLDAPNVVQKLLSIIRTWPDAEQRSAFRPTGASQSVLELAHELQHREIFIILRQHACGTLPPLQAVSSIALHQQLANDIRTLSEFVFTRTAPSLIIPAWISEEQLRRSKTTLLQATLENEHNAVASLLELACVRDLSRWSAAARMEPVRAAAPTTQITITPQHFSNLGIGVRVPVYTEDGPEHILPQHIKPFAGPFKFECTNTHHKQVTLTAFSINASTGSFERLGQPLYTLHPGRTESIDVECELEADTTEKFLLLCSMLTEQHAYVFDILSLEVQTREEI